MKRKILILLLALSAFSSVGIAEDKAVNTGISIDSTYVVRYRKLNDYSTLGIQYGATMSSASVQPTRTMEMIFRPINFGITYTTYCKLFGYMPYFGLQMGLLYTQEAYQYKKKDDGKYPYYVLGATRREMNVLEAPFMALLHYDFWKMRLMLDVGVYGGYRLNVHRDNYPYESLQTEYAEYENSFHPKENRWDFGIKAGGGFALIFDPFEIHITAAYKYSWSNIHKPNTDYKYDESKYYYNWTYPTNIVLSVGLHYQLTRRVGRTRKDLREEARMAVDMKYGKEDIDGDVPEMNGGNTIPANKDKSQEETKDESGEDTENNG